MQAPRSLALVLPAALIVAAQAYAAGRIIELRPSRIDGWLRASVSACNLLDTRTRSTIESGLPGTCIFELRLEDRAGRTLAEQYVERTLRLDLWEDCYILEEDGETFTHPTFAAADSALSRVHGCALCPLSRLDTTTEYRILVRIAVRPLAPEDRRRLSRYVSRTSAGGGGEVSLDLSAVFSHILGKEGRSRVSARHAGPFFRLAEIGTNGEDP